MTSTIVLISGANRGLGKGLLELYLAKPDHIVIAANRDPENAASKALAKLPTGSGSRLIVVKVDASIETDALEAVKTLTSQGIDHIDIVIANAGVSYAWPKVSELKIEDLQGHLVPNVFGVVWLYQATLPLLLKAERPKFATIGSTSGCLEVSCSSRERWYWVLFMIADFKQ
ncbi:norsolorinic acid reductase-like protein [Cadophora sp. DSE1049]|nr:norsolorinic acid reductase-like protein [Cadophora sp. DSE1049]